MSNQTGRIKNVMSELYVANVSKQVFMFAYRVPERSGTVVQPIQIGGQIKISPNGNNTQLSQPEIDAVVNHYRIYGMIDVREIDNSKEPFSGLCYSIDKPIPVAKLMDAMEKHAKKLEAFGKQIRSEAAVAVHDSIEQQSGPLRQLEMSVEEVEPRKGFDNSLPHVSEGVRVTRREEKQRSRR